MPVIDINKIINKLSNKRPVFHSEADFQHALAWEIHHKWPDCAMRLEFKPPNCSERMYTDIWAGDKDTVIAIELKYKTRGLDIEVLGEKFNLLDQSAQDLARYDYLKDIQRLEQIVLNNKAIAYAIFLTNDSAYWKVPPNEQTIDADFRIHQSKNLSGNAQWGHKASIGTTRGREKPIQINGKYNFNWQKYSTPSTSTSYGTFKYLIVEVGASA